MNRSRLATLSLVLLGTSARAAAPPKHPDLTAQQQFQAAAKEYDSGNYAEAVSKVQPLLVHQPHSFEVQELAGMAYAALGQDSQAIEHLQLAVQLRPADATAHTILAASLSHTGRTQ
ncbi:MAG: hypothetical protein KGK08_07260 [Acidobacteriota bacterium]|nr:hypothetical protein [Acidobacteriota bacterium]